MSKIEIHWYKYTYFIHIYNFLKTEFVTINSYPNPINIPCFMYVLLPAPRHRWGEHRIITWIAPNFVAKNKKINLSVSCKSICLEMVHIVSMCHWPNHITQLRHVLLHSMHCKRHYSKDNQKIWQASGQCGKGVTWWPRVLYQSPLWLSSDYIYYCFMQKILHLSPWEVSPLGVCKFFFFKSNRMWEESQYKSQSITEGSDCTNM